ncbi:MULTISPECIES: hypothetical protein [unclassified Plantactinospora]|uniref:hypothetical protein n=1 Tax=unclassified Plantactinospora TaxID=2631981 RepID=UPI00131F1CBE|nr:MULTISPECIES: hypothetical protein [unclassified Plantactinospora]
METIYALPRGDYDRPSASPISVAGAAPGDPRRVDSAPIAGIRARLVAGPPSIPHPPRTLRSSAPPAWSR